MLRSALRWFLKRRTWQHGPVSIELELGNLPRPRILREPGDFIALVFDAPSCDNVFAIEVVLDRRYWR